MNAYVRPSRALTLTLSGLILFSLLGILPAQTAAPAATAQTSTGRDRSLHNPGSFLTGPSQGDALDIALAYIRSRSADLGLTVDDLTDVVVTDRYVSRHNGVTHIYLRQRLDGIEVFDAN